MAIDLRRCAEAAAHAALAEAFAPPEPKRRRKRRRRIQPVRTVLIGVGLVTTVRIILDPEVRRSIIEAVAEHLPQELLDELVLDADVVPDSDHTDAGTESADATRPDAETDDAVSDTADSDEPATKRSKARTTTAQRRRPVSRARGDTNGRGGRKPPNRGSRA